MTEIRLHDPVVRGNAVHFSWTISPDVGFYRDPRFTLEFPESIRVGTVPEGVWLRVMLICLYTHFAVLRPCRVVLPNHLSPGEREFWLRMIDAAVWTLENDQDQPDGPSFSDRTGRVVQLVEAGPPAGLLSRAPGRSGVVASFSGGRDSLTQAAMLHELGRSPLLVTTISRREGSIEFETPRFRHVLEEMKARTSLEVIEVKSDIRTCFDNFHPLVARYGVAVSELTDTLLYFANCWVTACARGADSVFLASEAEAQESVRRAGLIIQIEHFGFSAATQRAISALIAPTGITYAGLISPLEHFQIQRILDTRYPELRDLQYTCYSQAPGEDACSDCWSCLKGALHKISDGTAPSEIGIDLDKVLAGRSDWSPSADGDRPRGSVAELYGARMNNHLVHVLRELDAPRVAAFAPDDVLSDSALDGLAKLRATAFSAPDPPEEPGYRECFLELLEEPLRDELRSLLGEHFEREPQERYAHLLENAMLLSDWIAAPLESAHAGVGSSPSPA